MKIRTVEQNEETQARIAAERLTSDVLSGALAPGVKLRVAELKSLYGIGASPLREALSRVASLGYVTNESRRGYRVAEMSQPDLADITRARQVVEVGMVRESMGRRDAEWEMGVVASWEQLKWVLRKNAGDRLGGERVAAAHKRLHTSIVAGSSSPRLLAMQDLLFDQAARYRALMLAELHSAADFLRTHEVLVELVLSEDIELAAGELEDHLHRTLREVYRA